MSPGVTRTLHYFWTYKFVEVGVWVIVIGVLGILLFLGLSAGVVARRTKKKGVRGAYTIAMLNEMSKKGEVDK
jgi:hypothetical protein